MPDQSKARNDLDFPHVGQRYRHWMGGLYSIAAIDCEDYCHLILESYEDGTLSRIGLDDFRENVAPGVSRFQQEHY